MKTNLELDHQFWLEEDSIVGKILIDIASKATSEEILPVFLNDEVKFRPEFYIQVHHDKILVFMNANDEDTPIRLLFTHKTEEKLSETHKPTRRIQTLANQKTINCENEKLRPFIKFMDENQCEWLYPLITEITPCNSSNFARIFGYNSFFYHWFKEAPKNLSSDVLELWKKYFQQIYHDSNLSKDLYWTHFYLILVCQELLVVLNEFDEYQSYNLQTLFPTLSLLIEQYFLSNQFQDITMRRILRKALRTTIIYNPPQQISDILYLFYQELISFSHRHKLGEYYTTIELCRDMVKTVYSPGESVLDPACGSGMFLLEAINLIIEDNKEINESALHALYGMDINPLSIIITKLNLMIAVLYLQKLSICREINWDRSVDVLLSHIDIGDYLFHKLDIKYDVILGNPPWIVINSINSEDYKEKLKILARTLRISTDTQNISNLEISSLFLEKSAGFHLKSGGKLFLVVSAGILTGSQNEKVRRFTNLKNICIWKFDHDLFNIHNVCILAEFGQEPPANKYRILVKNKVSTNHGNFITKSSETYIPVYIRAANNFYALHEVKDKIMEEEGGVGRFIPELKRTLRVEKSPYHNEFRQGACIGPRNLLFVSILPKGQNSSNLISIIPDSLIRSKRYGGWSYKAFDKTTIEYSYLHWVLKSTELVPFHILRYSTVFLPLKNDYSNRDALKKFQSLTENDLFELFGNDTRARDHYLFLHSTYINNIKSGAAIANLFENINYNNKLLHENQQQSKKVIYSGIGSKVKAAFVQTNALVDSSLYYYVPKSDLEAYYLVGVLNSPTITEFTKWMGSTGAGGSLRNIHKNPLKCYIGVYKGTPAQKMIAKLARSIEDYVKTYCFEFIFSQIQSALLCRFCSNCGKFFDAEKFKEHNQECVQSNDYQFYSEIFHSITEKEKLLLTNTNSLKQIILQMDLESPFNKYQKIWTLLSLLIKPKTLQNRLWKNELYQKKIHVLDTAVKRLWS
ncbi:MAG: N-6 DNA methylase [Candidatus Lokiarchaeota archaeon]|nr:N-6 DNA methylase [Candidatus Lokiarchaeota archaeon]